MKFSMLVPAALMLAILLAAAGRLEVWSFYAWTGMIALSGTTVQFILARRCPELLAERMKPPVDRDRLTRRLTFFPVLAALILAGVGVRLGWNGLPVWLMLAGLMLVGAGFALVAWVLTTNAFASSAVRIQAERDQHVITVGPYAFVRHPMYLAVLLVCLGSGLALGSWPAEVAFSAIVPLFVRRTLLEDDMLHAELPGYQTYARRVRWRVLPGLF